MQSEILLEVQMLQQKVWAVIGASPNPNKYGHMIYRKLKRKNYEVYAVNPLYTTIDGDPCYASLTALPQKPDVINLVVAPDRTLQYLQEAAGLEIRQVWLQPGTADDRVLDLIAQLGLTAVQACVLVATR